MSPLASPHLEFKGSRITLSKTVAEDMPLIMKMESDNNQFVTEYSREKHMDILEDKNYMHLSVKRNDNGKLVGLVLLFGIQDVNRVLEFRRLAISEKGAGFGRETIRIIKHYCFEQLKFHRLWLDVFDDNQRAIGLYESEGFVFEGLLRENHLSNGRFRSLRIYSILENEYLILKK